jgi:hypothetical protein
MVAQDSYQRGLVKVIATVAPVAATQRRAINHRARQIT